MNQSLLSLPREIIYKIAAADAHAYNILLRLCRTLTLLFPLSTRLDFMIDFGITMIMESGDTVWFWGEHMHDIFGPAGVYENGDVSYNYRDVWHRIDKPACVYTKRIEWYIHGRLHRNLTAPSGTSVEWLRGVASMIDDGGVYTGSRGDRLLDSTRTPVKISYSFVILTIHLSSPGGYI
jgi:hypothetical protein